MQNQKRAKRAAGPSPLHAMANEDSAGEAASPGALGSTSAKKATKRQPKGSAGPSLSPLKRALHAMANEDSAGEAASPGALSSTSAKKATKRQPKGSAGPSLSPLKRALHAMANEDSAGEAASPGALGSTSAKKATKRQPKGSAGTSPSPLKRTLDALTYEDGLKAPPAAHCSLFGATAPTERGQTAQVPPQAAAELPRFVHVDVGASAQPPQASSSTQQAAGGQAQVPPRKQRIELTPRQLEAVQRALKGENLFVTGSAGAVRACAYF
jgi:hypothetical protein